jgi:dethiobiotin synthetase
MHESERKTSLIVRMVKAMDLDFGYIILFGYRFMYRKKRLWDYDSSLIINIFNLDENPEDMTIGFHHSKLMYMLDEAMTRDKLNEIQSNIRKDAKLLFIEASKELSYGMSVYLDALSLTRFLDGKLLVVMDGGREGAILDDILSLKKLVTLDNVRLAGVIINKVSNVENFLNTTVQTIEGAGIRVLGVIPYRKELTFFSVNYLADHIFAKVIAGEEGFNRTVESMLIGAMSAGELQRHPVFQIKNKLVITSGDRSDMIRTALESGAACLVLTNNIMPSATMISMAKELRIPLLLVPTDTYSTARQIDQMEPLLAADETSKIDLLEDLVKTNVRLSEIV